MSFSRTRGSLPLAFLPIFSSLFFRPLAGCGTNDLFGQSGMPSFRGRFTLVRISKADARIAHQKQPVGVAIKMGLGEIPVVLRNVLVPELRRLVDVAIAIEHRKSLVVLPFALYAMTISLDMQR